MSFDFPSSPAENQLYTPAGGPTYIFKSPRWVVQGVPGGMPEAPNDGKPYVRKSLLWDDFTDDMALKENTANRGAANGYAPLDASQKVPAINLPAYVDDVLEFANLAAFPGTGTTGIIYVALDTNKVYRWSGSAYVEISPSPGSSDAVPEGSVNLYYTTARSNLKANLASPIFTGDPQAPTPATADNDTSIATTAFTQANMALKANTTHTHAEADVTNLVSDLALKAPIASPTFTGVPAGPTAAPSTNTTQLASTAFVTAAVTAAGGAAPSNSNPIMDSVAAPGASALYSRGDHVHPSDTTKANLASPTFTGTPAAPTATPGTNTTQLATTAFVTIADATKEPTISAGTTAQYWRGDKSWQTLDKTAVGLGNVDNTSDASKPISTAEQTALNLKAPLADPVFTGNPTAPTATAGDNDTSIATTSFVQTAIQVAKVTLSDTAPGSPVVGSLWYETDTGVLLIYYNDGTSSQWVQIAGSVV